MPFHRDHSATGTKDALSAGILSAAQALGSIGVPAQSGTTTAGTDALHSSRPNDSVFGGGRTVSYSSSGPPDADSANPFGTSSANSSNYLGSSRRAPAQGRQQDELHMPPPTSGPGRQGSYPYQQSGQLGQYQGPSDYSGNEPPSINLPPSAPLTAQYSNAAGSNNLPGALQPGLGSTRPGPPSANTAPTTVPTLPHISTQSNQPTTPSRSHTVNHSHAHTRSSPTGGYDNKYRSYGNDSNHKYQTSTPSTNYPGSAAATPQGAAFSPLGLADIRPRADSGFSDGPASPNIYGFAGQVATNSNYLAPFATYALDWCKWPSQNPHQSAGKIAIGSYLEDSHNHV